ncbi:hypothetical protein [Nocardioides aurantiacus]|uniref:Uncharacterized protein n=1 Tax=Nocardioides aurantiacus TaxID=86796 RepID=A0A3N2CS75_9ACTN|nr:hypothetical protein [Nocardioides aurantiacus]ROR90276.1 hypothetical protein EDD33_1112 [Nocardioides aurantiacus]
MARDLDYAPLTGRPGLLPRLRAVRASNIWVYSMTVGLVILLLPLTVVVGLVPLYETDPGFQVMMWAVAALGAYAVGAVLWQVRGESLLPAFAQTNRLDLTQGVSAQHYAGSRFADGSLMVLRSVRIREAGFLEVGDTFSAATPRRSSPTSGATGAPDVEVFLRVGLAGRVSQRSEGVDLLDAPLHERITRWAGTYAVECSDREVTLHGSRGLAAHDPARVREGFELARVLRDRADELLVVGPGDVPAAPTPSGIPVPVRERRTALAGRPMRPAVVVVATLGFLVVVPVLIAVAMSLVEQLSGAPWVASIVLGLVIAAAVAVAGALVRGVTRPRRPRDTRSSVDAPEPAP